MKATCKDVLKLTLVVAVGVFAIVGIEDFLRALSCHY